MRFFLFLGLCAMGLVGCYRAESDGGSGNCALDAYSGLIGKNIAAVTFPKDANLRVLGPNMAATMDYVPERVNLTYDEAGIIEGVSCG